MASSMGFPLGWNESVCGGRKGDDELSYGQLDMIRVGIDFGVDTCQRCWGLC